MIKKRLAVVCGAIFLVILLSGRAMAAQDEDGAAYFGSFLLSLLQFPVKLATCVGTQTVSAVAYVATFGVPGNYDGGTNGREIGEIARKSCTGSWVVSPDQVKKDYYP
jgi:hypothetical protein